MSSDVNKFIQLLLEVDSEDNNKETPIMSNGKIHLYEVILKETLIDLNCQTTLVG